MCYPQSGILSGLCYTSHAFRSGFSAVKNTFSLVKFYHFLTMNGTAPTVKGLYKHTPVHSYRSCVFFVQQKRSGTVTTTPGERQKGGSWGPFWGHQWSTNNRKSAYNPRQCWIFWFVFDSFCRCRTEFTKGYFDNCGGLALLAVLGEWRVCHRRLGLANLIKIWWKLQPWYAQKKKIFLHMFLSKTQQSSTLEACFLTSIWH